MGKEGPEVDVKQIHLKLKETFYLQLFFFFIGDKIVSFHYNYFSYNFFKP